jgi:hypothetical protein
MEKTDFFNSPRVAQRTPKGKLEINQPKTKLKICLCND